MYKFTPFPNELELTISLQYEASKPAKCAFFILSLSNLEFVETTPSSFTQYSLQQFIRKSFNVYQKERDRKEEARMQARKDWTDQWCVGTAHNTDVELVILPSLDFYRWHLPFWHRVLPCNNDSNNNKYTANAPLSGFLSLTPPLLTPGSSLQQWQ